MQHLERGRSTFLVHAVALIAFTDLFCFQNITKMSEKLNLWQKFMDLQFLHDAAAGIPSVQLSLVNSGDRLSNCLGVRIAHVSDPFFIFVWKTSDDDDETDIGGNLENRYSMDSDLSFVHTIGTYQYFDKPASLQSALRNDNDDSIFDNFSPLGWSGRVLDEQKLGYPNAVSCRS